MNRDCFGKILGSLFRTGQPGLLPPCMGMYCALKYRFPSYFESLQTRRSAFAVKQTFRPFSWTIDLGRFTSGIPSIHKVLFRCITDVLSDDPNLRYCAGKKHIPARHGNATQDAPPFAIRNYWAGTAVGRHPVRQSPATLQSISFSPQISQVAAFILPSARTNRGVLGHVNWL